MGAERFDELTRALAAGASRRTVLRALAASAAGAVFAPLGAPPVAASGRPCGAVGKHCRTHLDCCSGLYCNGDNKCVSSCVASGQLTAHTKGAHPSCDSGSCCRGVCFTNTGVCG
jgi:hypothetical protein